MLKKLIFIVFISISLFANSLYLDKVFTYDKQMKYANESQMLKIFHSLQSIYIKSIINSDDELKKQVLKRLVKSSKILKFDYSSYARELANYDDTVPKTTKKPLKKIVKKPQKKSILKLIKFYFNSKYIKLEFNKNIQKKDVKIFTLKGKRYYRKVFDFSAFLAIKPNKKKSKILQDIKIAQYNPKIMRLVLQSKHKKTFYPKYNKNTMYIYFSKKNKIKKRKESIVYKTFNPRDKIIVLDPGHGGKDSGAIGYKRRYEKGAVLAIALKCAKELKKRGYRVYLTRSGDYFVKLRNRTKYANKKNADLFISIHANAAPRKSKYLVSKGLETFFLSPDRSNRSKNVAALENRSDMEDMDYYSKNVFLNFMNREKIIQANKMSLDIQQAILKSLRTKYRVIDGGVREAPFWVLVGAQMPAILIETGYITNPTEGQRLFNFRYQQLLAKGIADGVDNYFLKN